jgi:hypothetical protein
MTDKEKNIRLVIKNFEESKIEGENAILQLQNLTGEVVELGYLREYWRSESLDTFIKKLIIEPLTDWETITDERALDLIDEIIANITDDSIIQRNSDALEKKYGKPAGFVSTKIFRENFDDSNILLSELKKETRLFL